MKLIHCADLHLDSKLSANLDKDKIKERKAEILHTFVRMVEYAVQNSISGILIAGDMFDTKNIAAGVRNTVYAQIKNHPEIDFYYLRGNHDNDNFLSEGDVPENLKLFGDTWTSYELADGRIVVSGMELTADNVGAVANTCVLNLNCFNIVMLHGQEGDEVNVKALKNKGIDYLALGHIHAYKRESLDVRGVYCYPGCLEGRGFDECGDHGFVVLDIDPETLKITDTFVSFAQRRLYEVAVDVTGLNSTEEMATKIEAVIADEGCDSTGMLKVVLVGEMDVECEKDVAYLTTKLSDKFYFVKIYDETRFQVNREDYMLDQSLKGEFVRQVMADVSLSEEDKNSIIRYGLQALAGEEIL